MSITPITSKISNAVRSLVAYREQVNARAALEQELALYSSKSDRAELEAIIGRHPVEDTAEVREALNRLDARAA
ncbi:hypothetical protein D1871_06600 [Nakamurella silvestris]|nr:hypothetical protein D1871_06600 [Nakamurella silvestris]